MNFPRLPNAKTFNGQITPEQGVIMKMLNSVFITREDEVILFETLGFYKEAFKYLREINLSKITEKEAVELVSFLNSVFTLDVFIQNDIYFEDIFRVTLVKDNFLIDGKVKDIKYIQHPPEKLIKELGVYGRVNSPNSSVFYGAFMPGSAVLESKPIPGQRIILAQWYNESKQLFNAYPITNNKNIDNELLKSATTAFQNKMERNHPLLKAIFETYLDFLSSEYVKDVEIKHDKKYEYIYSAFFADRSLKNSFPSLNKGVVPMKGYDCIIYPSVAAKYKSANLAIIPESVKKLRPIHLEESIVIETKYNNLDFEDYELPIERHVLRTATEFDGDKIIWSDDN